MSVHSSWLKVVDSILPILYIATPISVMFERISSPVNLHTIHQRKTQVGLGHISHVSCSSDDPQIHMYRVDPIYSHTQMIKRENLQYNYVYTVQFRKQLHKVYDHLICCIGLLCGEWWSNNSSLCIAIAHCYQYQCLCMLILIEMFPSPNSDYKTPLMVQWKLIKKDTFVKHNKVEVRMCDFVRTNRQTSWLQKNTCWIQHTRIIAFSCTGTGTSNNCPPRLCMFQRSVFLFIIMYISCLLKLRD